MEMALGAIKKANSDFAVVSITGIKDQEEYKTRGLVCFGFASKTNYETKNNQFWWKIGRDEVRKILAWRLYHA